ncbi:MAG: AsnC family transcriptional regulator [Streptosporangiales bacterium]|nr:AsnC family transcriptional regulator [Streptosporangiales bacterium]
MLTELDRALVAALHLKPRAPWELLARWLDASESTVARRAARLFDSGQVAVVGLVDRTSNGHGLEVSVRVGCRPGTVEPVLRAVAGDSDVRFAAALTGAGGILVEAVAADHEALLRLVDGSIGSVDGVVDHTTAVITDHHTGAYAWDPQILDKETADAIRARPDPAEPAERDTGDPLTEQESRIVEALGRDGRMSVTDLASAVGTSASTVRRRMDSLSRRGILHFRTVVEPSILGFGAEYMLWLETEPTRTATVAARLAAHPAVRYLVGTSGEYTLFGACALTRGEDLADFLSEALGDGRGVRRAHPHLVLRAAKRHWRRTR